MNFIQAIIINASEQLAANCMMAKRIDLLSRKIGVIAVELPMVWL
ncbi:MAG: hypothetical protein V7K55_10810 [Nostoc sp.]